MNQKEYNKISTQNFIFYTYTYTYIHIYIFLTAYLYLHSKEPIQLAQKMARQRKQEIREKF